MTILFANDWRKYPGAIIDTQTKNKSFIQIAKRYKEMGVRNHTFMLALHNPKLQGVDPYSSDLTTEQMGMIVQECQENFWYYIREVARAPASSGSDHGLFEANRGNIALYWLFFNGITTMLVQIRQTGKSFSMNQLAVYLMLIRCRNTEASLLTKDETLRSLTISKRLKDIYDTLPPYFAWRTPSDERNKESFMVSVFNNAYKGYLSNKSEKAAYNTGRGITSPIFFVDELCYMFNAATAISAALKAGGDARDRARKKGEPCGTILATTAGKKDDPDGRYGYNILMNSAQWSEKFFDVEDREALENVIRKNSKSRAVAFGNEKINRGYLRVACSFNHRQLGKTDEWLRQAIEDSMSDQDLDIDRDFFNVWTDGSANHPLQKELLEAIRGSIEDPIYTEITQDDYILRWHRTEHELNDIFQTQDVVMAIDPSDVVGQDDLSIHFRLASTGESLGAGQINETNLYAFIHWLAEFIIARPKILLIVERRGPGSAILDALIEILLARGIDPFMRLYNRIMSYPEEFKREYQEISKPMFARDKGIYRDPAFKKQFGFATSGSGSTSRKDLYSETLTHAAKYTGHLVKDNVTAQQILELEIRNNRVDHPLGGHDDAVIAWLLTHWFLTKTKNLVGYGIDAPRVFSRNDIMRKLNNEENSFEYREQERIRDQIEICYEKLSQTRDVYLKQRLEKELRFLASGLKLRPGETFSIDELLGGLEKDEQIQTYMQSNSPSYDYQSSYYPTYPTSYNYTYQPYRR